MGKRDPNLEAKWRETISSWKESGQTAKAFCKDRGVTEGAFHSWRRELRRRDGEEPNARPRRVPKRSKSAGSRFVQLQVDAGEHPPHMLQDPHRAVRQQ